MHLKPAAIAFLLLCIVTPLTLWAQQSNSENAPPSTTSTSDQSHVIESKTAAGDKELTIIDDNGSLRIVQTPTKPGQAAITTKQNRGAQPPAPPTPITPSTPTPGSVNMTNPQPIRTPEGSVVPNPNAPTPNGPLPPANNAPLIGVTPPSSILNAPGNVPNQPLTGVAPPSTVLSTPPNMTRPNNALNPPAQQTPVPVSH